MFTVPSNIDLILGLGLGLPLGLILSLLVLLLMCLLCRRRRRARRSSTDSEFSSVDPWVLIDAFRQLNWVFFLFQPIQTLFISYVNRWSLYYLLDSWYCELYLENIIYSWVFDSFVVLWKGALMHLHNLFSVFFLDYLNHGFELKELIFRHDFYYSYHIRAAFGSVSSKISGHKPQEFGGLGVGMFGASPFGQQPRDIIDSQRQQQEFPELPFSYGNRFYRPEGDTFNESSYFGEWFHLIVITSVVCILLLIKYEWFWFDKISGFLRFLFFRIS